MANREVYPTPKLLTSVKIIYNVTKVLKLIKLITSMALVFVAAAIGSAATLPNISTWYATIEKPFFSPPNWVFGPVWTLLYLLIGLSLYLVWVARYKKPKTPALAVFGLQLTLNILWSVVFFGLHAPWVGVAVIVLLLVSIAATIRLFWPISKASAYLLLPYAAWVGFATILNTAVALLN